MCTIRYGTSFKNATLALSQRPGRKIWQHKISSIEVRKCPTKK
jgi:hypothetical protein